MALNVFGDPLAVCSAQPLTGFYRNGKCDTCGEDVGMHTVCAEISAEFLAFSRSVGNDLSTPMPEFQFPGLQPGDFWCVCLPRWIEAFQAGYAPRLRLSATHISVLEYVDLEVLQQHAVPET